jgi:hypothetical protein
MKAHHVIIVCGVLLVFGAAFALPAIDLPQTAYDESETQPYESVPQVSIAMAHASGTAGELLRVPLAIRQSAHSQLESPRVVLRETLPDADSPTLAAQVFPIRC